nr:MAG TPA: hypothetical protein [Caudoviricetes sp.]
MLDEKITRLSLPAFESIDFQGYDPVCKKLIITIEDYRTESNGEVNEKVNKAFCTIFQRILRDRFKLKGLTFQIIPERGFNAIAQTPSIVKNSVMVRTYSNQLGHAGAGKAAIDKNLNNGVGWVNRATATVGGFFQEMPCSVMVTQELISSPDVNPDEVVAIILHEVGHIFTYLETLAYTFSTCFILVDTVKRLEKSNSPEEKVKILMGVENFSGIKISNLDVVAEEDINPGVLAISIFSDIYDQTKSEFGASIYDMRSWESLSDQFSSRMGLTVPLATGLDKIQKNMTEKTLKDHFQLWGMKIIRFFFILGFAVNKFGFNFRKYIELLVLLIKPVDRVYDKADERLERLRQDIIQRMKEPGLLPEERVELSQNIDVIANLKSNLDEESYYEKLWLFFSSRLRDQKEKRILLQDLQAVANNNLFAAANLLNTLK